MNSNFEAELSETFDGSKPNLISSRLMKDIDTKLNVSHISTDNNKMLSGIGSFYNNYILPNMFAIIVIMLLVIYLTIRYVLKKDKEEREEEENDDDEYDKKRKSKIKKSMVKIDPDDIIKNHKKTNEGVIDVDISDMISDDYMITDLDEDDQQSNHDNIQFDYPDDNINDITNNNLVMDAYTRNQEMFDTNKMAKIIFGED